MYISIREFKKRFNALIMAYEFIVNSTDDLLKISSFTYDHFEEGGKPLKFKATAMGKRSLSQNAFMHIIFDEISKYLVSKGRTDWTPEFTKEMMKHNLLGWEDRQYIDVKTGQKAVRSVLKKTSTLDKGEALNFITRLLEWSESIGCYIKVPDCEYRDLMEKQNE